MFRSQSEVVLNTGNSGAQLAAIGPVLLAPFPDQKGQIAEVRRELGGSGRKPDFGLRETPPKYVELAFEFASQRVDALVGLVDALVGLVDSISELLASLIESVAKFLARFFELRVQARTKCLHLIPDEAKDLELTVRRIAHDDTLPR
jgi:hypothetical protein